VLGVSLGGHAAWQVFFNEPRVTAAAVIIGCPDYIREFFSFALQSYNQDALLF
jgi:pimeloyl-ACP methyl ester carboxylesterase